MLRIWPLLLCALLASPLSLAEGQACEAWEDVDRLVDLVHQRLMLAEPVARYKWNRRMPIEDLPREQVVIESLARRAALEGLPAPLAEAFFRAQIEASKAEQRALFERWREAGVVNFRDAPDLVTETRPQLDALTPKLIAALARLWPQLAEETPCRQLFVRQVRERHQVAGWHYPNALRIATAPLAEVAAVE